MNTIQSFGERDGVALIRVSRASVDSQVVEAAERLSARLHRVSAATARGRESRPARPGTDF